MNRKIAISAIVVVAAALLATLVMAQEPPAVYYACVNNTSGTIHMIHEGETCSGNEQLVVWNATGPQGPQGPEGPAGPAGSAAGSGFTSAMTLTVDFLDDVIGPAGPTGPQGSAGPEGPTGPAGESWFDANVVPVSAEANLAIGEKLDVFAECPPGAKILYGAFDADDGVRVTRSSPTIIVSTGNEAWRVKGENLNQDQTAHVLSIAVCALPPGSSAP